jgi:T3SS (YopN, CesT) and YbjN peptide-binding chaperone 3
MDTNAVILDAVERVAGGRDESLVVHSARDSNLWVQVSRVEGESALLCEAVGDEYLGRDRELGRAAVDKIKALGWQDVPAADFTLWADAETADQRKRLADLLERTLVTVLGHDPVVPPVVSPP